VIECGAGLAIPTIRNLSEHHTHTTKGTLIRINPRDPDVPSPSCISIQANAREALEAIAAAMRK
jgi:hypothetical protein